MRNIKKLRESKRLSINQLAELSGVPLDVLREAENSVFYRLSFEDKTRLAEVLDCKLGDLIAKDHPKHYTNVKLNLERLTQFRQDHNMSWYKLAICCNICYQTLTQYQKKENPAVYFSTVIRISEATGIPASELVVREEKEQESL